MAVGSGVHLPGAWRTLCCRCCSPMWGRRSGYRPVRRKLELAKRFSLGPDKRPRTCRSTGKPVRRLA